MAGKPAATVGSNHICPMCSGTVPHVGGPITQGEPTVLFNGKPVATIGSMCTCVGPPDTIVQGNPTVLINGKAIACVGDMSAHGGAIVSGEANIIIGSGGSSPTTIMPIKKIPFPKITFTNRVLGNVKKAIANQQKIKDLSENNEGEPKIYNLQWIKEEKTTRESKEFKDVTLLAHVLNIPDGETLTFTVKKPVTSNNQKGNSTENEEDLIELTGTVQDKMIEVIWKIEDFTEKNTNETN